MTPLELRQAWSAMGDSDEGRARFSTMLGTSVPYSGSISATVEALESGHARVRIDEHAAIRNHLGSVHAIALMNLGEISTGLAVMAALPDTGRGIITDLGMQYVKKARGRITAEARVTLPSAPGDHEVEVEGSLHDADGDEVARARALWRIEIPPAS